jgi:hypothetical protein
LPEAHLQACSEVLLAGEVESLKHFEHKLTINPTRMLWEIDAKSEILIYREIIGESNTNSVFCVNAEYVDVPCCVVNGVVERPLDNENDVKPSVGFCGPLYCVITP